MDLWVAHRLSQIATGITKPAMFPREVSSGSAPATGIWKPRILVVDDEGLIADSLAEILNENGYEAQAVYGGAAAIEAAEKSRPDLLLTDVLMPKIDGIETAIRVVRACEKTRVLLFSGQAGTADLLNKAHSAGLSFELLPKPIHPQHLLRTLSSMLQH